MFLVQQNLYFAYTYNDYWHQMLRTITKNSMINILYYTPPPKPQNPKTPKPQNPMRIKQKVNRFVIIS